MELIHRATEKVSELAEAAKEILTGARPVTDEEMRVAAESLDELRTKKREEERRLDELIAAAAERCAHLQNRLSDLEVTNEDEAAAAKADFDRLHQEKMTELKTIDEMIRKAAEEYSNLKIRRDEEKNAAAREVTMAKGEYDFFRMRLDEERARTDRELTAANDHCSQLKEAADVREHEQRQEIAAAQHEVGALRHRLEEMEQRAARETADIEEKTMQTAWTGQKEQKLAEERMNRLKDELTTLENQRLDVEMSGADVEIAADVLERNVRERAAAVQPTAFEAQLETEKCRQLNDWKKETEKEREEQIIEATEKLESLKQKRLVEEHKHDGQEVQKVSPMLGKTAAKLIAERSFEAADVPMDEQRMRHQKMMNECRSAIAKQTGEQQSSSTELTNRSAEIH